MMRYRTPSLLALTVLLAGCGRESSTPELPSFQDPDLTQGRNTWMQVCRNCHLLGVAGAPAISNTEAWQPRAAKGRDALYRSALNGIRQGDGWSMPPRGGEDRLSDAQVRRAVDYMLAVAVGLPQGNSDASR